MQPRRIDPCDKLAVLMGVKEHLALTPEQFRLLAIQDIAGTPPKHDARREVR